MDVTGKIIDVGRDLYTGKVRMTFELNETETARAGYDELKGLDKLRVVVKPYRKKRSLDANAYAWTLIDQLAEKMRLPREEVYRRAILRIGGVSETVCVVDEAVDQLCKAWCSRGIGWMYDRTKSKLKGCSNLTLYYGSSVYDTKQMAALIDDVVQDCQAVGIETKTPAQIEKMLALWGEEN